MIYKMNIELTIKKQNIISFVFSLVDIGVLISLVCGIEINEMFYSCQSGSLL